MLQVLLFSNFLEKHSILQVLSLSNFQNKRSLLQILSFFNLPKNVSSRKFHYFLIYVFDYLFFFTYVTRGLE